MSSVVRIRFFILAILLISLLFIGCKKVSKPFCDIDSRRSMFQSDLRSLDALRKDLSLTDSEYEIRTLALLRQHLDNLLELAVIDPAIPAMAVGVTTLEEDLYIGVNGVRKLGKDTAVEMDNYFHTGSNTKAMTATLAGILVNQRLLRWDSKPEEVLNMNIPSREGDTLTLAHLLTHTGGIPAYTRFNDFEKSPKFKGDVSAQRRQFAQWILPQRKSVGTYEYSNAGYAVVAAMAETVTNKRWEDLMDIYVFKPLGIEAFIGWPGKEDASQPWGHSDNKGLAEKDSPKGAVRPHPPDHWYDLHEYNRPAGDVSMSIGDYMKFLREHLRGLQGKSQLMSRNVFAYLHTPATESNSACGWGVNTNALTGLEVHGHSGSAGTFYMIAGLFPDADFGIAVVANAGSGDAITVCKDLLKAILVIYWDWHNRNKP